MPSRRPKNLTLFELGDTIRALPPRKGTVSGLRGDGRGVRLLAARFAMDPGLRPQSRSPRCPDIPNRPSPPSNNRSTSSPWSANTSPSTVPARSTRPCARSTTITTPRSNSTPSANRINAGAAAPAATSSISSRTYERVDFPEALRMLAERAGVTLEGSAQGPNSRGPVEDRAAGRHRLGRARLRRGPGRLGRGPRLRRGARDLRRERRAVPPRLRPRVPRLAAGACPEGGPLGRASWSGSAWSSRTGRSPRPGPRAVPRPADVPDPRPGGARPRLRRPRSCRRSSERSPRPARGSRNT